MSVRICESLESRRLFADTFNASIDESNTHQTVDAIGVAVTSTQQQTAYRSADFMNKVVGDLGITAVRSPLAAGFELGNDDNNPNTFNWAGFNDSAIASTMEFFVQAKARGVKTFLLTAWSPPAWMKTNKAGTNGGQLRPEFRDEYAEYLTAAVVRAKQKWGVDITQVSIANEPAFVEPYASSIWFPKQWATELKVVAARFKKQGLATQLVGPEEVADLYRTQRYLDAAVADPEASAALPIVGNHYLSDANMVNLAGIVAPLNKKIWYSEVGNGDATLAGAIGLARGMDSAFTYGNASAWLNWQLTGTNSYESLMDGTTPNPKYYALKHFAHFVRPGMQRLDVQSPAAPNDPMRITAFHDPATNAYTVVLSNYGTADVNVNLALSGATIPAQFRQYRTSATENCAQIQPVAGGANTSVTLPANSIVTLCAGPDLVTPQLSTASPLVTPIAYADAWNSDPLRKAAFLGDLATVQSLIAGGANVNAAFGNGWTPLFTAAASPYNNSDLIIQALLNAGADAQHRDVEGFTALHVATQNPFPAYGTDEAVGLRRVNTLLAAGLDMNARDGYGRTALHYAAMLPKIYGDLSTQDTAVLQRLLAVGADQTVRDNTNKTAYDYAVGEGATAAVALLNVTPPVIVGSVEARAFKDVDGNGVQDTGDTALAGVTVYIDTNSNGVFDAAEPTAVTGATGVVTFPNLSVGSYTVRATRPDTTYTPATLAVVVNVSANGTATAALPFVPPVAPPAGTSVISGYVVYDKNSDGKWSGGELGIAGRTVYLDTNKNGLLDAGELSQVTVANGRYVFNGLAAGTYTIREILPAGWTQTYPTANAAFTSNLKAADFRTYDFKVNGTTVTPPAPPPGTGTASVTAYLVNDVNRDGRWNAGEFGIAGRTVWLDLDNDGVLDTGEATAVTGKNGVFSFTKLTAGTYSIRQILPSGWKQTYPAAGTALVIKLAAGEVKSGNNFGTALA